MFIWTQGTEYLFELKEQTLYLKQTIYSKPQLANSSLEHVRRSVLLPAVWLLLLSAHPYFDAAPIESTQHQLIDVTSAVTCNVTFAVAPAVT